MINIFNKSERGLEAQSNLRYLQKAVKNFMVSFNQIDSLLTFCKENLNTLSEYEISRLGTLLKESDNILQENVDISMSNDSKNINCNLKQIENINFQFELNDKCPVKKFNLNQDKCITIKRLLENLKERLDKTLVAHSEIIKSYESNNQATLYSDQEKVTSVTKLVSSNSVNSILPHLDNFKSNKVPDFLKLKVESDVIDVNYNINVNTMIDKNAIEIENVHNDLPNELSSTMISNRLKESQILENNFKEVANSINLDSVDYKTKTDELKPKNNSETVTNNLIYINNPVIKNLIYQDPNNQYQIGYDEDGNLVAKLLDENNTNAVAISYNNETDKAKITLENNKSYVINYFSEKVEDYRIATSLNSELNYQDNQNSIELTNQTNTATLIEDQIIEQTKELIPESKNETIIPVESNNNDIEQLQKKKAELESQLTKQSESKDQDSTKDEPTQKEQEPVIEPVVKTTKPIPKPKSQQPPQAPKPIINKPKQKPEILNQNLTTPDTLYDFLNNLYDTPIPVNNIKETTDRIMGKSKLEKLKSKYSSDK